MIKRNEAAILAFIALFLLTTAAPAAASDSRAAIRLWGSRSPFLSGSAGSGEGAPDYNDAFSAGLAGGAEFSFRFCPWFSGVGGVGYEVFDGDSYKDVSFSDARIVPVYLGGKFHLISDDDPLDFYLRTDLGAAYFSSVDVSVNSMSGKYWDSSWVFLFDAGVGTEFRRGAWGMSLEAKARYLDAPDSALGTPSEADSCWTFPVTIGLNYHF